MISRDIVKEYFSHPFVSMLWNCSTTARINNLILKMLQKCHPILRLKDEFTTEQILFYRALED